MKNVFVLCVHAVSDHARVVYKTHTVIQWIVKCSF